jgi:plasmid stabilization system protein ParE
MPYSLHPKAETELVDAFTYYREQAGSKLASLFLEEFVRIATLLTANPGFGTPTVGGTTRSYPFRRFPYSLIYRSEPNGLRILVVGHQHRRPGYGRGRN